MIRCVIKSGIWTLYNKDAFIDINPDNSISFGYLMFENDLSYKSKEYILNNAPHYNKLDALYQAYEFISNCSACNNFDELEDYIFEEASRFMQALHA